jgi:hypothetical protein
VVEGSARFVGGDIGSKVYVTSDIPNQIVKLRVQVGDCVSRPIEFTAFTVEPLSVKTTVWIVGNKDGTYFARTENEVRSMMVDVNKIYEQIGVSFYIDSISYTNRDEFLDISINQLTENLTMRRNLVNISTNTGGIELYFNNRISKSTVANHDSYGIVLTTNATAMTLAHELGHAFGCSDIYPKGRLPPKPSLPDSFPKEEFAPFDWNNGTGSRYYEFSITQETLIKRLLMYGFYHVDKRDMSLGSIYGFTMYDNEAGLVDVGFFRGNSRKQIMIHR